VIRAAQLIADGQHDVVISGATDASIMPLWIAAYRQMGILADPHPRYGAEFACQPFDRDRRGFAVGEGAAILILASRAGAQRLHARPWAEISGWSSGTDPAGLTRATEDATPLANVLGKTLARADRCPDQLVAVHAHGTATALNDTGETRALRLVLGDSALESVPLISLKGAIGHLMGAAGAVEVALAAQSAIHGRSPGNTTLMHPDPELGRLCLPRESWGHSPGPVLKVSQGFGGQLAAVIIEPVR
jgi:3-oxoacyl-(acyl-carrier-protein) synthase